MGFGSSGELTRWIDRRVIDQAGRTVGVVVDIYSDLVTGRPSWLAISTGFFGTRVVVAPVRGASLLGDDVVIAVPRDVVESAPHVRAVVGIPPEQELAVLDHYTRQPTNEAT
ncbi:MAG: PRC-barrel domain-containing protein [Ilumatobacteraceae bacterium]